MDTKFFYKSLSPEVLEKVYEPSDDSFLLADSIKESDAKGKTALDLGCGSGIQGLNALLLGAKKLVFADIDNNALRNARLNAERNNFSKKCAFKKSDLFSALGRKKFGLIIFNPPYAESEEKKWLDVDGGKKGREILDKFLKQMKPHLEKGGAVFFVQSSLNGETKTKKLLKEQGFNCKVVARKRLFFEELMVLKCFKQ